jgi:hypothetical protein
MSKTTQQLWDEYCERSHNANPASWIIVSTTVAEKLNQLKKIKNGRKRSKS